jgi:3-hydroxyisobutyrate dehydrogenase-like beta-hydroxyacid dehydrogenase
MSGAPLPDLGFVGLGNMGAPICGRLLDAGHRMIVCDVDPGAVARLGARGATGAESPREVADRVETVFTSLPTPESLEAVVLGVDGVLEGSAVRRLVDLSTVGAATAERVAAALLARGIAYLDAPVSGGVGGAEAGTLAVMIAGSAAEIDAVRPMLERFGRKLFEIGAEPGLAQVMKLVNNYLSATAIAVSGEALAVGAKAGIDPDVMVEVINAGTGRNTATESKFPNSILTRSFDAGFAISGMNKDLRLFIEQATSTGVTLFIGSEVRQLWQHGVDQLGPDADMTEVVKPIEQWAGVELHGGGGEPA